MINLISIQLTQSETFPIQSVLVPLDSGEFLLKILNQCDTRELPPCHSVSPAKYLTKRAV